MSSITKKSFIWLASIFIAVSLIASTSIATYGLIRIKGHTKTITVTGSAKQQIKSDFIVWKGSFSSQSTTLPQAYKNLSGDLFKVKEYLKSRGIEEKDVIISPINTVTNNIILPNGQWTNQIESYRLIQEVEIRSTEVDKITEISRNSTALINDGIQFQSFSPQYFYTKISDLKINMLALATKDAKNRAEQIAINSGTKVSSLHSSKIGVFQITPLYSNEVSDYGINDTSSIEKEIMAVVNCVFSAK